jgi:outer membrane immunogenic protein
MKRILFATAAMAVLSGASALAADMPAKAPYAAQAQYDPWTGFYAGVGIGARAQEGEWTSAATTGGGAAPITPPNTAPIDKTGFWAGGYLGYNWRVAPALLAGFEADIGWGDNKKAITPFPGGFAGAGVNFDTVKLGWDASLRGRLGVLVAPTWLLYGTGGVAWQEIKTISSCGTGGGFCGGGITVSGTSSTAKAGWTVGGGVETALPNHWLARVEYRYADFGHVTNDLPVAPVTGLHSIISVKTHTGLFGLAYKY